MRRRLLNNWVLKLASLMLAVILWFLVAQIGDPKDTKTFNNISVKLINTDLLVNENKVYEVLDNTNTVSVTVRAPKSVINQLRSTDIVAEADVSKLTDINTIAISYSIPYVEGVDSIEGNHDAVRLNVEDKSTRWIKVVYNTVGEVAENHIVASAEPDQTLIEVSGPKSVVDTISYAGVEIDVTGYTSNLSANVDIELFDKDGNRVEHDNVKKNVNYVHMAVEILATKEVPIEVNYMGTPAEGYIATGAVLREPATVKIAGTSYVLSGINKISIPEDRLNITGASDDMTDVINLREYLPDYVRFADSDFNGKVTAIVSIEPLVERTLEVPLENVTITNLPEGLKLQFSEELEHFDLKVSGLAAHINPLRQTDIMGVIDIGAWMEQQEMTELAADAYTIPVNFVLDENITAEGVTVWVSITENI